MEVGQMVTCVNYYTGKRTERKIIAVSKGGRKVTVERLDWLTKKAEFSLAPKTGFYSNHYSSEQFK